jgi:hypothetical protein
MQATDDEKVECPEAYDGKGGVAIKVVKEGSIYE